LADIATEAGFYDQAHLCRHFRRIFGHSPGHLLRPH
jgi:transcriptional regulator GlxA family with amidase domain